MWFLNFHVFHLIWFCFTIISFIDIILSKFLRYEKPPLISTFSSSCVCFPWTPASMFSKWFFFFFNLFFPTGQSLFPYTHCLFPSPLSAQLCLPEMPLITVLCFLKQTLRPGQCWAAHFSAGLITVPSARPSGADQRPPPRTNRGQSIGAVKPWQGACDCVTVAWTNIAHPHMQTCRLSGLPPKC